MYKRDILESSMLIAANLGPSTMAVRVVEFSNGEILLPKNQHTQRKLLNFEFFINWDLSRSAEIFFGPEKHEKNCPQIGLIIPQ